MGKASSRKKPWQFQGVTRREEKDSTTTNKDDLVDKNRHNRNVMVVMGKEKGDGAYAEENRVGWGLEPD
jgi:hypothetical protein